MRRQSIEPRIVKPDLAGTDGKPSADQIEQGRFAGAVRADQRVALTAADVQVHAANDLSGAEVLGDLDEFQAWGGHRSPRARAMSIRQDQTWGKAFASRTSQPPPPARQSSATSQGIAVSTLSSVPNSTKCLPCALPMVRNDSSSTRPTKPSSTISPGRNKRA